VFAVPLTSTPRTFPSHIPIDPDAGNGLAVPSCALVEQLRAVARERCSPPQGNVGPAVSHQILDVLAMITGMP
jgi:mRNA-degrading endonuclease toxin of MazEF toxin-antitoxin module